MTQCINLPVHQHACASHPGQCQLQGLSTACLLLADNTDAYENDGGGLGLTQSHLRDFLKWLSQTARGMGLSIGLKNTLLLINDDLVKYFDFAINEQCSEYNEVGRAHLLQLTWGRGRQEQGLADMGNKFCRCVFFCNDQAVKQRCCAGGATHPQTNPTDHVQWLAPAVLLRPVQCDSYKPFTAGEYHPNHMPISCSAPLSIVYACITTPILFSV